MKITNAWFLFLIPLLLLAQPAGATDGIECGCGKIGHYTDPVPGVEPAKVHVSPNNWTSPNGIYRVTETYTGAVVNLIVTRIATGATVLQLAPPWSATWGFSPDDDRFVYQYMNGALHNVYLHNLIGTTPNVAVKTYAMTTGTSRTLFSPQGRYFFYAALTSASNTSLNLADARTGSVAYQTNFNFQTPPGLSGDVWGVANWGFSPDDYDRTFVYSYLSGQSSVEWFVVNLEKNLTPRNSSNATVRNETLLAISSFWQFSPCGDLIGIVTQPFPTQINVRLFRTVNGTLATNPSQTFTLADAIFRSTSASHIINVGGGGGTDHTLAANTAGAVCPGGGGGTTNNLAPAAAFSAPSSIRQGIAASFTDNSTDADGTVVAWLWNFGDGTTATAKNPVHTYASAGPFTITLRVTDNRGATGTATRILSILPNNPPHASFSFLPSAPIARDVVAFTDTSTDDDGITSRYWSFGSSTPVAQIKVCATLDVSLTVYDGTGQSDTVTQTITVIAPSSREIFVPAGGSLMDAVALACAGDTIRLDSGTFTGGVKLAGIDLRGAGRSQTIVTGRSASNGFWVIWSQPLSGSSNTISDLAIRGGGLHDSSGLPIAGGGVYADNDGLTRLLNVDVSDNYGRGGVFASGNSAHLDVRNSVILRNTNQYGYGGGGITINCCGTAIIKNNEVGFNSADVGGGIASDEANQVSITGNFIHDNFASDFGGGLWTNNFGKGDLVANNRIVANTATSGGGVAVYRHGSVLFYGNLVARNNNGGVHLFNCGGGFNLSGSTIVDNTGAGLAIGGQCSGRVGGPISNSIIAGNTVDIDGTPGTVIGVRTGTPPPFLAGGDYRLAPGSTAIDGGSNAAIPLAASFPDILAFDPDLSNILIRDIDGDPRILDGNGDALSVADIGYDEANIAIPRLAGRIVSKGRDSAGRFYVDLRIANTGNGHARNIGVNQLVLRTVSGTGSVTLNTPAVPIAVGNVDVGMAVTLRILLNIPSTVTKFSMTENGVVQDVVGTNYGYSIGQVVVP